MAAAFAPAEVAAAVRAAADPMAAADARAAATNYLNSARAAPAAAKAAAGAALCADVSDVSVALFGYSLLADAVRYQWDALDAATRAQLIDLSIRSLRGIAEDAAAAPRVPRVIRSKAGVLAAEMHRVAPSAQRSEILAAVCALAAPGCAPAAAEVVCYVLAAVSDDATVHVDELDGEERRTLLSDVTGALGDILALLYRTLESSFVAAMGAAQQGGGAQQALQAHASALNAALAAVGAFANWAPLTALAQSRVAEACAAIMGVEELRGGALSCLKLLLERKRGREADAQAYDHMAGVALQALCKAADSIPPRASHADEFPQIVCNSLAASATNLGNLPAEWQEGMLQRMLRFLDSPSVHQSFAAVGFWVTVMREGAYAGRSAELQSTLLALCCKRCVRFTRETGPEDTYPEEEFDSAGEYHDFFSNYRHKLVDLTRVLAGMSPSLAARALLEQMRAVAEVGARAEAAVLAGQSARAALAELEATTVFAGGIAGVYERLDAARITTQDVEAITQAVQGVAGCMWSSKPVMDKLAQLLEGLAPLYGLVVPALPAVLQCLFGSLQRVPASRLGSASCLYKLVRRSPRAFMAHRAALTQATDAVQPLLTFREWGFLATAALTIACHEGQDAAMGTVRWIMTPFQRDPQLQAWIATYTQSFDGFMRGAFACTLVNGVWVQSSDSVEVNAALERRRVVFHTFEVVHRLHRSLNTAGANVERASLKREADWLLMPLLATVRHLHNVWINRLQLSEPLLSALAMSGLEVAVMLGGGRGTVLEQKASAIEAGEYHDIDGVSSACLRNWMNGLRDNSYGMLALCFGSLTASEALTRAFVECAGDAAALRAMEHKHVRMLIRHVLQPLVRFECADGARLLLTAIYRELFPQMYTRLTEGWASLAAGASAGGALLPARAGEPAANAAESDVVLDRIMRELSREYAGLLGSLVAAPASFYLDALLQEGGAAAQALVLFPAACVCFPDGESSHRICGLAAELVSRACKDARLHAPVGTDLLRAAINALLLETNANHFAEVLTIIQRVLVSLSPHVPAVRQTMLSFISEQALAQLEADFTRKGGGSEKTRNAVIKRCLQMQSGGALKALASQAKTAPLTNLPTPHTRAPKPHPAIAAAQADADEAAAPKLDFS